MKKIISISLLSVFLFNTMGYYIAFKAIQIRIENEIEQKVHQGINAYGFSILVINKNSIKNIQWMCDDNEVKYNGEFYDIIRSDNKPDGIILYCTRDKQEDILYAALDEHINTNVIDTKPAKGTSSKKIDHEVELYCLQETLFLYDLIALNKTFLTTDLSYISPFMETNSPPPKFV